MPGPALIVSIVGDASKLSKELGVADQKVSAFGKSIDIGGVAKMGALVGGVGLAVGALAELGTIAGQDRDEANALALAISKATGSTADYTAEVDAAITAGQERAFTDSQTRDALQSLVTATGDVTASTALLSTAQDVARFAGVDLATAADAIAKAQAGQDMQLARLIPGLEKGATATDTIANAQRLAAGQADRFAASTEGQMARSSDAMAELGETIGSAVLPILDALLPALIPIIQALSRIVQAILPVLIPLIKLLAAALTIVAQVIGRVANLLADLIDNFMRGIGVVRKFIDALPDLGGIKLPFGLAATAPTGAGVTALASGPGARAVSSGVTVNIYGGDPTRVEAAVARALRGYTRRNGPLGLAGMPGR